MDEQIGHYRIVAELGRGGMGVVYKAHEQSLNRFVAIKVLGEHLTEDPAYVQRFLREAQSAAQLNHPNIVQIYTIAEDKGRHYFVMEYVTGTSLQGMLRAKGKLDTTQAARLMLQTAAGLQAAHERNIVHRDIKPANLMITDRGLVKIADFGLALIAGGASRLTATGMFMGTPGYLSPEQCLDRDVDHRTDIYSLGVTYFETISGSMPFRADSPLALLRQIIEVEPPDVRELNPNVDDETRTILGRMMAKDRDRRYPTCQELINDLQGYLEGRGVSSQEVAGVTSGVAAAVVGGVPATAPRIPPLPGAEEAPTVRVGSATAPAAAATVADVAPPPLPGPPAPPPVAATPPAASPEPVPVAVATAEGRAPSRGRTVALVVAAVLVLGFVGLAAAVGVAWKTGLLGRAWKQVRGARSEQTVTSAQGVTGDAAVAVPETATGDEVEAEADVATATAGDASRPATVEAAGSDRPPVEAANSDRARPAGQQDQAVPPPEPHRPPPARLSQRPPEDLEPERPAAAAPRGTVVVAVGESLLAGEAESFLDAALAGLGVRVVDEDAIPALMGQLGQPPDRNPGQLIELLRPFARTIVIVNAEYLGQRELRYMGRSDVAFQSRLKVVAVDMATDRPLGQPLEEKVEYTQLSVGRKAEEAVRPFVRRVAQLVGAGG